METKNVPRDPTPEMLEEGREFACCGKSKACAWDAWQSMFDAAPTRPTANLGEDEKLVESLRHYGESISHACADGDLCIAAADRIEQLRAVLADARGWLEAFIGCLEGTDHFSPQVVPDIRHSIVKIDAASS